MLFQDLSTSLLILLNLIRKYKLELKYTLLWLIVMLIIVFLSIFPKGFSIVSQLMGIELPVNALYLLAFFCSFAILFSLTMTISNSTTKIKELSQQIGLLKYEIEQLKK